MKQRGVTLIELLVTITILAILAGIAAPSFIRLIADNTLSTQVNSLLADTRYARSEAMKRGISITICPSADSDAASPSCSGSDWKTGWIVFVDNNGNATRDGGDDLLRRQEKFNGSYSITGVGGTTVTGWRFNSEGRIPGSPNGLQFAGPSSGTAQNRYLCVSNSGRVKLAPKGATSCA